MAIDPGVRDAYLGMLSGELDRRQDELGRVREQLKTGRLEQAAVAALPPDTTATLRTAAIIGKIDVIALQTRLDTLIAETDAIKALVAAAKGAA